MTRGLAPGRRRLRALRLGAVVGEVAARHGFPRRPPRLRPEHAAVPGRAAGAARGELRAAERVSGRDVPRAARGRRRVRGRRGRASGRRRRGRRADPPLRAHIPRPRRARRRSTKPTYALYRMATQSRAPRSSAADDERRLSGAATRTTRPGRRREPPSSSRSPRAPDDDVVVDEAYVEFGGESVVPFIAEAPNLIVLRTLSKAFGFASLRVGYAVAAPEIAAVLEERRAPAPSPARPRGSARRRCGTRGSSTSRRRRRAGTRARPRSLAAGHDCPPTATNFVFLRSEEPLGRPARGAGPRRARRERRHPDHAPRPAENDVILAALGAAAARTRPRRRRRPDDHRDRAARDARPRRLGPDTDRDRHRVPRPPADALGVPRRLRSRAARGRRPRRRRAPHGGGRARRARRRPGPGARHREGVTRYGAATVPMDEARATAAVDLVRRPHAEIALAFAGERVGGLALSLLPHALERFAMQAGCTVHVEARGRGRPPRRRGGVQGARPGAARGVSHPAAAGIRSTKGAA